MATLIDGVFAIAATLLALEVTVPIVHDATSGADLTTALLATGFVSPSEGGSTPEGGGGHGPTVLIAGG